MKNLKEMLKLKYSNAEIEYCNESYGNYFAIIKETLYNIEDYHYVSGNICNGKLYETMNVLSASKMKA